MPVKVDIPATLRFPDKSKLENSDVPVVLIPGMVTFVSAEPSPIKEVAVTEPLTLTLPTVMSVVLLSLYELIPTLSSFTLPLTYFILV